MSEWSSRKMGVYYTQAREKELERNHHDPEFFRGVVGMILKEILRPYKEGLGIEVWAKIIQEEVDKVKPKKEKM